MTKIISLRYTLQSIFLNFWLIAFPSAYLLAFGLHLGGIGIWLGLIVGLFVGAVISLSRFKYLVENLDLNKLMAK